MELEKENGGEMVRIVTTLMKVRHLRQKSGAGCEEEPLALPSRFHLRVVSD